MLVGVYNVNGSCGKAYIRDRESLRDGIMAISVKFPTRRESDFTAQHMRCRLKARQLSTCRYTIQLIS